MNELTDRLNADLKKAMLAGDKQLVLTLKGIKSSLQYAAVDLGAGNELSQQQALSVLQKESKKRGDAADIYIGANDSERAEKEKYEKKIIDGYLPEMLGEEEVVKLVDEVIASQEEPTIQKMGMIISQVKEKSNGRAEGSLIARLVKEKLSR